MLANVPIELSRIAIQESVQPVPALANSASIPDTALLVRHPFPFTSTYAFWYVQTAFTMKRSTPQTLVNPATTEATCVINVITKRTASAAFQAPILLFKIIPANCSVLTTSTLPMLLLALNALTVLYTALLVPMPLPASPAILHPQGPISMPRTAWRHALLELSVTMRP